MPLFLLDHSACPFNTCLLTLRVLSAEVQKLELHQRMFELSEQLIRFVERVLLVRKDSQLGPLPCKYFKSFLTTLLRFDQLGNSRRFFIRLVELVSDLLQPGYSITVYYCIYNLELCMLISYDLHAYFAFYFMILQTGSLRIESSCGCCEYAAASSITLNGRDYRCIRVCSRNSDSESATSFQGS